MRRVFVVGCARSGTTLTQAMLSAHPDVCGFPETFYYLHSRLPKREQPRYISYQRHQRQAVYAFQEALNRLSACRSWRSTLVNFLPAHYVDALFLGELDRIAQTSGCQTWSEKTPGHVNCIARIQKTCPDALFVHVLRDGRDVVASLEDLRRTAKVSAPELATWDVDESIEQWNRCIEISKSRVGNELHHIVRYDGLVEDPKEEIASLCDFLSVDFDDAMLAYTSSAPGVLGQDNKNVWRTDVQGPLKKTHLVKFNSIFTSEERENISSKLLNGGRIDQIGSI